MKKVKVYWTPFALKNLDKIRDYIIKEAHSETIAIKYINKLIDRVEQLQKFPDSGSEEDLLKHLKQNSRYLVEGNYKIIYQYQDDKVIVILLRLLKEISIKLKLPSVCIYQTQSELLLNLQ